MKHHIFISYSHIDLEIKKKVQATFRQVGLLVWSDSNLVPGTHSWTVAIEEAIENAGCVVVMMSPAAKDSEWVNREVSYARAQNIPIIPLLVRGTTSSAIPIKLIETQYADIRENYEQGMGKLILTIKQELTSASEESLVDSSPTHPAAPTESLHALQYGVTLQTRKRWTNWLAWGGGVAAVIILAVLVIILASQSAQTGVTPTPGSVGIHETVTDTPTLRPTLTPADTLTPTDTRTPTPATPVIQPVRNVVVRLGPGITYPVVATIVANEIVEISGVDESNSWYKVRLNDGSDAWVIASQVDTFGNIRVVPIAPPPTITPSPTPVPTDTRTPTPTDTPTNTATLTPSPTDTPVDTVTPTPSPTRITTDTATPSNTPVDTATSTIPPTDMPTNTATPTLTDTPTDTATPTASPTDTATPVPQGAFPYMNAFNLPAALDGWEVDPAIWKLRNESGRGMVLEGTGTGSSRLDAPAIILADTTADWKRSADFVMRFSFNIEANSDSVGARVIYRSSEAGYNVLEFLRGTVILRRSGNDVGQRLLSRDQEPVVRRRSNIHLDGNTWHDVVIWVQSDRLDIYLDGVPLTPIEDISPEFHAGQIMLQVIGNRPVAFDDLTIDRIDEAATHFEDDSIPESWTGNAARFEGESDGNRYLLLRGAASITTASTWGDFEAECRIWDVEGSYRIRLRQSEAGAVALDYNIFGTLIVSRLDGDDMPVWDGLPVANFHGRSNWVNLRLIFRGDQLRIYANGVQAFSATIPDAPPAGAVVFETTAPRDNLRVDDCIFLNSAP